MDCYQYETKKIAMDCYQFGTKQKPMDFEMQNKQTFILMTNH